MTHFGIIGKPVAHSFSEQYFTDKFTLEHIQADYKRFELDTIEHVGTYLNQLDGCNITIPFKQTILPYLDSIDEVAQQIGAVNVVDKHKKGYNTDWIGFTRSIQPLLLPTDLNALILGTGGVAKAVYYALQRLGIQPTYVSRHTPNLTYDNLTADIIRQHTIIVNCTPLGMWPNINDCPNIDYSAITTAHLLYDCIYNPQETLFLKHGKEQGARIKNGLEMLHIQADEAWQIWNNQNNAI